MFQKSKPIKFIKSISFIKIYHFYSIYKIKNLLSSILLKNTTTSKSIHRIHRLYQFYKPYELYRFLELILSLNSSSVKIVTFNFCAFCNLLPAFSPASKYVVLFETASLTFPPAFKIIAL